jgi:hypothetical protein
MTIIVAARFMASACSWVSVVTGPFYRENPDESFFAPFLTPDPSPKLRGEQIVPFSILLSRISATVFPSPPGRGDRGEGSNSFSLLREKG